MAVIGGSAGTEAPAGGRFPALIMALRWATVTTGAILSLLDLRGSVTAMAATSLLCLYAGFRILRPLPAPEGRDAPAAGIALELAIATAAVAISGGWASPYVFVVLVPVLLAGFTRGYLGGFAAAGAAAATLLVAGATISSAQAPTETASQVVLVYAATGALAGYARRLFVDAAAEQASFEDRVAGLTEANALLSQLTQVALTLPSSLDLGDTVAAAMGHLGQLFDFTGAAVLVLDAATGTWRAEGAAGLPPPAPMPTSQLPPPLLQLALRNGLQVSAGGAVAELDLDPAVGRPGLWPETRSGIYAPLVARDHLVALVALERADAGGFDARDAEVLSGLAEPLALAIDNGLWFDRLRMLGAEGERDRLARDLHDRFAQGLAYVNLELDRLSRHPAPGPQLVELRGHVHGLLGDVRETLRQLRSRVSPTAGVADLLAAELPRFAERTGITARFAAESGTPRLPVTVEQELWRISQEALGNVERHSKATALDVTWTCDGRHGRLVVADNGGGFDPSGLVMAASSTSGMTAMRERANAIGARLLVDTHPGGGTWIQVEVAVNADAPGPLSLRKPPA
ncbi:MAG TPA: GAF domain-containing sensor histidine kinase [Acidimicrobiia bacterium]|nr:GAF domain-containing sensor histidine kinase [Acidimicrobiia bacterium]